MGARATALNPPLPLGGGEAPTSLLSRHAHLHGRRLHGFCRDLALDLRGIVDGAARALAALALRADVAAGALEAEAFRKIGERRWEHKGEIVTGSALSRATRRVCPLCLLGDVAGAGDDRHAAHHAYGRAQWTLDPIRSCPHHGVALVVVASGGAPGEAHDFAGAVMPLLGDPPALERLADPVVPSAMEHYLLARLAGRGDGGWLDGLAWHAAADACQTIGAVSLHGADVRFDDLSDDAWRAAGSAGYGIAAGGEPSIRDLLGALDRSYEGSRSSNDGPQARYGALFRRIAFTLKERDFDPLRAIVKRHVQETSAVGPRDALFGEPFERRVVHSIRSASLEYGVHPKRLRKILVASQVLGPESATVTDERCVFPAEDNDALLRTAARCLSLTQVETHLGAGRVHAKLLADAGLIRPFIDLGTGPGGEKNYAAADLDAFLDRLFAGAEAVAEAPPGTCGVPAAAKRANCGAMEIVRLILDGRLDWVGRVDGVSGYMSVVVDLDEVKRNVHGPSHEGLTAKDVEKRLGTRTMTVTALIERGHLPTSTIVNPVNRCPTRVIGPAKVAEFEATYVSLHRLAGERGVHFARLLKTIEAAGIRPVFEKEIYHATFYRRADVTAI